MIRLSDLRGAKVMTSDGETLGRVHEVHCEKQRIVEFSCGPASLIEMLTARNKGRPISWECVRDLRRGEIIVELEPK